MRNYTAIMSHFYNYYGYRQTGGEKEIGFPIMSLSVPLHHLGVSGLLQHEYSRPHQVHEIRGEAACPFGELIGTVLNH